ncbi:ATP-dependent DNA helicase, partial [Burkholderia pseudomallei]
LAQAPTGIAKTRGARSPMQTACGTAHLDRLFFLTAMTPGRALALDAADTLRAAGGGVLPLRVLVLVARDKACEHPDAACHGES